MTVDPAEVMRNHAPCKAGHAEPLCFGCSHQESWPCERYRLAEALSAATSNAANCFQLDHVGRVAELTQRAEQAEAQVARYDALSRDTSWLRAKLRHSDAHLTSAACGNAASHFARGGDVLAPVQCSHNLDGIVSEPRYRGDPYPWHAYCACGWRDALGRDTRVNARWQYDHNHTPEETS